MKSKKLLTLSLSALLLAALLCSCGTTAETGSESESIKETENGSAISETENKESSETAKNSASEEELIDRLLPEFEWEKNADWEKKLDQIDPTDTLYVNDKPAVYIQLTGITDQMVSELVAAREWSDGAVMRDYMAERHLLQALTKKFKEQCVKDKRDFIELGYTTVLPSMPPRRIWNTMQAVSR